MVQTAAEKRAENRYRYQAQKRPRTVREDDPHRGEAHTAVVGEVGHDILFPTIPHVAQIQGDTGAIILDGQRVRVKES